jgi:hypothetical protein
VRWLGWQTYRFIVDLAGQFRTLRRRTEKAGRGFERFRRFLVLLTYLLTYLPTYLQGELQLARQRPRRD